MKVSSRTGSGYVKNAIEAFYRLWTRLERAYVSEEIPAEISDGRYRRVLLRPAAALGSAKIAKAIADYIDAFDNLLNEYFSDLENGTADPKQIEYDFRRAFYGKPAI